MAEKGIKAEVIDIHTIKPLDKKAVIESVAKTGAAVCAEEHLIAGGLGEAIAGLLAAEHPAYEGLWSGCCPYCYCSRKGNGQKEIMAEQEKRQLSDTQLIELYKAGKTNEAFRLIVQKYKERLYWLVRGMCNSHQVLGESPSSIPGSTE